MPSQITRDLSTFKIYSEGNELPETIHVLSIIVDRSINRIPFARLILKDGDASSQDFENSNLSEFNPGNIIKIEAGFHNQNQQIFEGIIVKQNIRLKDGKESFLIIECKDKTYKMTLERKNKYFLELSDSDTAESIIGLYGLQKDIGSTAGVHKQLVQYNSSDWDFILSRMEMNGMIVYAEDGKLISKKPEVSSTANVSASFGDDVINFEALLDATNQYETVTCKGWNVSELAISEAGNDSLGLTEAGDLTSSALAGKVNGSTIEYFNSGKLTVDELKSWANARQTKNVLSKSRGIVNCKGTFDAKVADTLELTGFGNHFSGMYFISGVRHELKDSLWETNIQFGLSPELFTSEFNVNNPPASGLIPAVSGLQIGIVTNLEGDPESEFRIQVKFPLMDNQAEGIWARIALLDAGNERGSFFMPEIDDEVIVGFVNNDPRDAIVLGMLNSSSKPAFFTPANDNNEKGFVTRSKMKLTFDDEKKIITIHTPAGKEIILDEDQNKIILKDENDNMIEMSADGIVMESCKDIKLKATGDIKGEGVNVEMKGSGNFKAEGSGGAKVSSSGTTELKGSIININ